MHGKVAGSSNVTLLVTCALGFDELRAVYKPTRGERPLWDFPSGLHRREVAAYVLSERLSWGIVPRRSTGPTPPSVRARCSASSRRTHIALLHPARRGALARHPVTFAAFDILANNANRKSGHVLWPRTGCGPSTTGCASTKSRSCAP